MKMKYKTTLAQYNQYVIMSTQTNQQPFERNDMSNYTSTFDLERWSKYDNTTKTYQVAISYVNPSTHEWYSEILSAKTFYGLLFKLHFRELTRNSKTKSTDIIGDLSYTKESLWKIKWCKDKGLDEYNRVSWRAAKRAYEETI